MKKLLISMSAAAFVVALATPLMASETTLSGKVVDVTCTMKDKANAGEAHLACATACAKKGLPIGIMTADGSIYTITGDYAKDNNAKLIAYLAKDVKATGAVTEENGKKTIDVSALKIDKGM